MVVNHKDPMVLWEGTGKTKVAPPSHAGKACLRITLVLVGVIVLLVVGAVVGVTRHYKEDVFSTRIHGDELQVTERLIQVAPICSAPEPFDCITMPCRGYMWDDQIGTCSVCLHSVVPRRRACDPITAWAYVEMNSTGGLCHRSGNLAFVGKYTQNTLNATGHSPWTDSKSIFLNVENLIAGKGTKSFEGRTGFGSVVGFVNTANFRAGKLTVDCNINVLFTS